MQTCKSCKKEFGTPVTLRIHENNCETVASKVVKAVKKVIKKK